MAFRAAIAAAAALALASCAAADVHHGDNMVLSPKLMTDFFAAGGVPFTGTEDIPTMRHKIVRRGLSWAEEQLTHESVIDDVAKLVHKHHLPQTAEVPEREQVRTWVHELVTQHDQLHPVLERDPTTGAYKPFGGMEYPYFAFLPPKVANVIPGGPAVTWKAACWNSNTATASKPVNGIVTITVTVDQQQGFLCSDSYWFGTVESIKMGVKFSTRGAQTVSWNVTTARPSELYDVTTRGIRIFHMPLTGLDPITSVLDTVLLFTPLLSKGVPASGAARNMDFLAKYADIDMANRTTPNVDIDPSTIQSGDFFGIIRLDGLDPMLAWAMGSTTGHTTVALHDDDGQLYIHESTANDSYWPTNGIQRTPWKTWIQQARDAGFNLVHAPLKKEVAAKFDIKGALAFFNSTQGLNYGYHNMLMSWIDTVKDNYPCVAPNFTQCLEWDHVVALFGMLDNVAPAASDMILNQAFNIRMNTTGLRMADFLQLADTRKIAPDTIPTIVEEDSFVYNITRYGKPSRGPSMVCCVFVCHTWKAAGVFDGIDNEMNCGEMTNFDDYALTILDTPTRPPACVKADPNNQLCQLSGDYTLNLNKYSTRTMYKHMAEHCPSIAPHYPEPAGC